jgi:hypothetical protein
VAILRRIFLSITTIAIYVATATPSTAATNGHSIPWASLGIVRPLLIQPAGWGGPIAAQPGSTNFGWCSPNGVNIATNGEKPVLVPDGPVGRLLKKSHLLLPSSGVGASCEDVALDPSHPKTVYAGFNASQNGSVPPDFNVALVTSNLGKSWRYVPPPHGYSVTDFAGFIEEHGNVELLYEPNYFFPLKVGQSATFTAATSSNGGLSWTDVRLGCSTGKPCVIFGPEAPQGACGMSEWQQSVLVAVSGQGTASSRWRPTGTVKSVFQCGSQQLVATTSGDHFLIDRSRPDALLYTRDGIDWTSVVLPKIDGQPVGSRFTYLNQAMTITTNGVLLAVSGTPDVTAERIDILLPQSKVWCAASVTLPAASRHNPVAAVQSSSSRLVVAFRTPIPTGHGDVASALTFPLSTLRCRT